MIVIALLFKTNITIATDIKDIAIPMKIYMILSINYLTSSNLYYTCCTVLFVILEPEFKMGIYHSCFLLPGLNAGLVSHNRIDSPDIYWLKYKSVSRIPQELIS